MQNTVLFESAKDCACSTEKNLKLLLKNYWKILLLLLLFNGS